VVFQRPAEIDLIEPGAVDTIRRRLAETGEYGVPASGGLVTSGNE